MIFEKENIDTSNMNSEMILTCLSSFAQGESESISGNVTKGIRMGYRQGKFSFHYKNFLGYRKGPDGEPEIVPEEAEVIRLIAQNFLNGDSLITIKKTLERMGILTATGNKNWSTESIQRILQNEKYMGDVLLQKTYTADFIEGKVKEKQWDSPTILYQRPSPCHYPKRDVLPNSRGNRPQKQQEACQHQESENQPRPVHQQVRFVGKAGLRRLRRLLPACNLEHSWEKANCLALHYPAGMRSESLQEFPSLEEGTLHAAILAAIRSLVQGRQEEMAAALQDTLINCISGENDEASPIVIKNRLDELDKELDRLLTMEENEITDRRIRQISDEMLRLKQMKKRAELSAQQNIGRENKAKEILSLLRAEDLDLTEYSDALVYRIIERITVLSKEKSASDLRADLRSLSPFIEKQAQRNAGRTYPAGVSLCLLFYIDRN